MCSSDLEVELDEGGVAATDVEVGEGAGVDVRLGGGDVGVGDEGGLNGQRRAAREQERTERGLPNCSTRRSRQTSSPHNDPSSAFHVATGARRNSGNTALVCSVLGRSVQYH